MLKTYFSLPRIVLAVLLATLWTGTSSAFNLAIGTMQPGESVSITFETTISSTLTPSTIQITAQGTISATSVTTVVTDDPETTSSMTDSTKTPLFNNPPVLDLDSGNAADDLTVAFTEQTPVLISSTGTIWDNEGNAIKSLKATLTSRPDGNSVESLSLNGPATAAASGAGLTVAYVATTGVLTISSAAGTSTNTFQTILRGILYNNTSDSPLTTSRTITVVPNDGNDGIARTTTVTIATIADTPSVSSATTTEGTQTTSGLVLSRNAGDGTEVTHFKITGISNGTLYKNDGTTAIGDGDFITFAEGNAGLKFTPGANLTSPGTTFGFTIQASTSGADPGLGGGTATATITVNPAPHVNLAPGFAKGANQVVQTNVGPQTVSGWATAISAGTGESSQTVDFIVSNDNNGLFSNQPAISSTGVLTFEPSPNASGKATVTVRIHDDGGTANGGTDTSAPQTFTIAVMVLPFRSGDVVVADQGPLTSTGGVILVRADRTQALISSVLNDPAGIAFDNSGNIIVADFNTTDLLGTGGLYRFDRYSLDRSTVSSGGNFVAPFDLAVEADGSILVADRDAFGDIGAVFRVNPNTGAQTTLSTGGNFLELLGLTVNTNTGTIYVTDLVSPTPGNESVIEINPVTGAQTILSSGGNFFVPSGLAIEYATGDIIVADAGTRMIIRVDKTTGAQTVISSDTQFLEPTHLVVDATSGDFYVTDGKQGANVGERRLYRVDKNTGVASVLSCGGLFDQPRGLVLVPTDVAPAPISLSICCVTPPNGGSYREGQDLDFRLYFTEPVNVDTSGGTPTISLTIGTDSRVATLVSGSGSSLLTFQYTVQAGDMDSDGIEAGSSVDLNGATIQDLAGNDAILTFTRPDTTTVIVNFFGPTISGTVSGQTVDDNATLAPFSAVSIGDLDLPAQTLAISVTMDSAAKGVFSILSGFTSGGAGDYTFSGTSSDATAAIRGLVYNPANNRGTVGSTETTTFTIAVSDGTGGTASDSDTTVISTSINDPPVAGNNTLLRTPGHTAKISKAELLSNDSDPDSETLVISLPSPTSANGATVAIEGGWILYSNPPSDNNDSFTYRVSDPHGQSATATVDVQVQPDQSQSANVLSIANDGSDIVLTFAGIPALNYVIQYTTSLGSPNWIQLGTVNAASNGLIEYRDVNPPPPTRYYRTFVP